ncbi:MAG TPA: DinB family protein [Thermoanaerobaculia bacterium]|nr:DinB family protein [Thermoanaerobaculia bacterium]
MRPDPATEYAPHHEKYVSLITDPVLVALRDQRREIVELFGSLSDEQASRRYGEGKWNLREVLGHIIDGDRVFGFRAFAFARGEASALPTYDPDGYVKKGGYDARSMSSLLSEFLAVRDSVIQLFDTLEPDAWSRGGTASNAKVTVRGLAYIAAGHAAHHLKIVRERYLK